MNWETVTDVSKVFIPGVEIGVELHNEVLVAMTLTWGLDAIKIVPGHYIGLEVLQPKKDKEAASG